MALPPEMRSVALAFDALLSAILICWIWFQRSIESSKSLFQAKAYWVAVGLEVGAIYLASIVLPKFGLQSYFLQTVGVIVGLHFIGLWLATGFRRFLAISASMVFASASACFLSAHSSGWNPRNFVTGLGNALILWTAASGVFQYLASANGRST